MVPYQQVSLSNLVEGLKTPETSGFCLLKHLPHQFAPNTTLHYKAICLYCMYASETKRSPHLYLPDHWGDFRRHSILATGNGVEHNLRRGGPILHGALFP